jgi:CHASE3 domain sensor protein
MIQAMALAPESKEKLKTLAHRLTTAGTYLLAGWIVLAGVEIHQMATYGKRWSEAQQNMVIIEKVFSDLKDCESGQRGYIITADPDYLAQYAAGTAALDYDRRVMSAYLEPQATQRGSLTELDQVLNAKMGEMQFALDAFDREGFEAAKMVIKTNRGAQQMQHVRYLMDVIRAREQGVLKQGVLPLPF